MSADVAKKTKSSLYWNISLKIPYEIFKFAMSIATARILDPSDFGIVSVATFAIYYSNSFTNFGFNQALVQRKEITDGHINTVFTFDLIVSILFTILIFISAGTIAEFFNSPESKNVIRVLSVVFIFTALHDLPYVLMRREIEFKVIAIVDMAREVSMSIITLILAYSGFKYWAIVWGLLVPLFFAMLYLIYKLNRTLKLSYHHASLVELFNFSIWSFANMQVSFISNRIDRIVIGKALNVTSLGIYEKAKGLIQMPSHSIVENITTVLFSSFSRAQDNKDEIKKIFNKGLIIISALNFPIFFGIYSIAPHFVLVLLGEKWEPMILPFQILAISGIFASLNGLLSALAISTGHYKQYVLRFSASTCILVMGVILVANSGIEAVAAILILYTLILFILSFNLVKNVFEMKWMNLFSCVLPALSSSIFMFIIMETGKFYFFSDITIINLIMLVFLGGVIFTFSMAVIPSNALGEIRGSIYRDGRKIWEQFRDRKAS